MWVNDSHKSHNTRTCIDTVHRTVHMFWWSRSSHILFLFVSLSLAGWLSTVFGAAIPLFICWRMSFSSRGKTLKYFYEKCVLKHYIKALIEIYLRKSLKKKSIEKIHFAHRKMPEASSDLYACICACVSVEPWSVDGSIDTRNQMCVWPLQCLPHTMCYIIKMLIIIVISR